MPRHILFFVVLCVTSTVSAQRDSTNIDRAFYYFGRARQAFRDHDFQKYFSELKKVHTELPYHVPLIYNVAQAAFLSGNVDDGKQRLNDVIGTGAWFDVQADTSISKRITEADLLSITTRMTANKQPVVSGRRAIEIPELDLAIEGIAYDPTSGSFFVSSIHKQKIIRIDKNGTVSDFSNPADSLLGVYGMFSDGKRLWACNIAVPQSIGYEKMKDKRSFISVHEIATGKLIDRIYCPSPTGQIKDVTVTPDGVIYFTDMRDNLVYELRNGAPTPITKPGSVGNALGITASTDGRYLFVADHLQGVLRLERSSGRLIMVKPMKGTSIQGIDGLYYSNGKLLAVQNARGFSRAVICTMNRSMDEIIAMKVMDSYHPDHDWPTLGVVAGKQFYYVANSQWNNFSTKGTINQPANSKPTYILSIPIR